MKYLVVILLSALLSGCGLFVKPKFPEAEASLMVSCKDLFQLSGDTVTISQFMTSVVDNYTLYHQCANKVVGWQEWYEKQKKIYEESN